MAAQRTETVAVEGRVVKIEHRKGSFTGSEGDERTYDYYEVKLLTPEYDVTMVRFPPDGPVPLPQQGETARYICEARPAGGNVRLTVVGRTRYTYAELLTLVTGEVAAGEAV